MVRFTNCAKRKFAVVEWPNKANGHLKQNIAVFQLQIGLERTNIGPKRVSLQATKICKKILLKPSFC